MNLLQVPPAAPQSMEAEQAVLGAVLLSDASLNILQAEDLRPEHFYREGYGHVYHAMLQLAEAGEPVEELTLIEELRRTGRLDEIGGVAAIQALAGAVPHLSSLASYARVVIMHARGRRALDLTYRIQDAARRGDDELEVLVGNLAELTAAPLARAERLRRLRMLDVDRMLETEPPPVDWIVHGLLVRGNVTMLAGREGQGKTMLALALASAIGHGATVAGFRCKPGHVLVIDAENGEHEIHRRLQGLEVKKGTVAYAETEGFSLTRDIKLVEDVIKDMRAAGRAPDVVVWDSFRSLAPGVDENDSGECEMVLALLRTLTRNHGCAGLLLHHAGKSGGDGYRGSTGIGASVQLGFTLARHEDDPEGRTRRRLTCWKCRPAPEPAVRWLALESGEGRVLLGEADPFEGDERHAAAPLVDRLAEVARKRGPMPWAAICSAIGEDPESGTVKRARKDAIDAGLLIKVKHGVYGPPEQGFDETGQPSGQTSTWPDEPGPGDGSSTVRPASPLRCADGRTVRVEDLDGPTVRPTGQMAGRIDPDQSQPSGQPARWPDGSEHTFVVEVDATTIADEEVEAIVERFLATIDGGIVEEVNC